MRILALPNVYECADDFWCELVSTGTEYGEYGGLDLIVVVVLCLVHLLRDVGIECFKLLIVVDDASFGGEELPVSQWNSESPTLHVGGDDKWERMEYHLRCFLKLYELQLSGFGFLILGGS